MTSNPVNRAIVRMLHLKEWLGWKFWTFCIMLSSGVLLLHNLGHRGLTYWDESFHAIVARNLTKHPLKFTLYDQPWLPYDYKGWGENHIWLHKPPVAMWEICLSYYIFGINTFALRLPSAITATIGVWLTYKIAADLFDKRTGVIAAFLQAFNPFLFASIHGYRYSDHIDIALLFWVQVSCWFLLRAIRTGKRRLYVLSGVGMGLAYLSKSYLALITFGIALVVWIASRLNGQISKWRLQRASDESPPQEPSSELPLLDLEDGSIQLRDLGIQLGAAILTVAPWAIYCLIRYPKEYIWEHKRVIDHLNTDIESWGATWDRPLFDYMVLFYPVFYVAVIAAVVCLVWVMYKQRKLGEFFILAWSIGVIVPHTLAHTKTPSATMIAAPPLLICLAVIISRAWVQKDWFYTTIWFASMFAITVVKGGKTLVQGRDQFDSIEKFAPFVDTNFWIIKQFIVCGLIFAVLVGAYRFTRRFRWQNGFWWGLRIAALVLTLFYAKGYVASAVDVTKRNVDDPLYATIGPRIGRELPENACLFLDDATVGAHFSLMYYADRSTYQINNQYMTSPREAAAEAKKVREAGGIPYLVAVTGETYAYPVSLEGQVTLGGGEVRVYRVYELIGSK